MSCDPARPERETCEELPVMSFVLELIWCVTCAINHGSIIMLV
jgi:hypothetical protein